MIVHEQLSFQDALSLATKRIFETNGRSRRSEFWWAMLVAYFISNFLPPFVVFGKYIFFCGIVSVYQIVMIIFFCQDSAEGENRYGASPKYEEEPPCVPPEERKE